MGFVGWRTATAEALYGPGGFFVGAGGPGGHFRTSVHASPLFAGALGRLVERIDVALGRPAVFDLVDVGAGRGELLTALGGVLPAALAGRVRRVAVELAPRPAGLDPAIGWRRDVPEGITGMLLATEWLDNVPLDLAEVDERGRLRLVLVDPATGAETLGGPVSAADRFWIARWWPGVDPATRAGGGPGGAGRVGARVELGWTRDVAWADAVSAVRRGGALAVDYGHLAADRPVRGTLTGYRAGRRVTPVPDGSTDITAHVALDSAAAATGTAYELIGQREALRALGVHGARPPLDLARSDPAGYLRALSGAGDAAELTDPAGLGGHRWLLHTIGVGHRASMGG